jgi:DNA-binding NtrC family response regulator
MIFCSRVLWRRHHRSKARRRDSPSAKRKLEADTYELVIIDMLMPGAGDLQLVKFTETQGIPVLLTRLAIRMLKLRCSSLIHSFRSHSSQ